MSFYAVHLDHGFGAEALADFNTEEEAMDFVANRGDNAFIVRYCEYCKRASEAGDHDDAHCIKP